ncbi:ATP adenylyltransferase [Malassezia vespertilionis]|uniref:Apa2p n=1 Tax=Malassezia vespertilionis TaxID=2020962 RepID=A0A2N1JC76_9BASI|nr:ATP adenylyltransferase [Malassezia vespertilionis]PKI84149.1 Apa2p [Malassezia vespertilionis]WFD06894.1 ATP adenylyltransferase [Malassezia vespertilionis]
MAAPPEALQILSSKVAERYAKAVENGDAFFYDSHVDVVGGDVKENVEAGAHVPWQIRMVPALLKKDQAMDAAQKSEPPKESVQQNKKDVFAPPYVPNLLVAEFPEHTVLLNKFCVFPRHHLLVTREFVKQELPPSPAMIALVYRIIVAFPAPDSEVQMLGFFNCGEASGASQPHSHFQLVDLQPPANTAEAIPIQVLLDRIERDGKEYDHVHMLPLPWQQFCVLLDPPSDEAALESYFGNKFTELLDAMFSVAAKSGQKRAGPPSFNVLLTKRAMYVVPRAEESFDLNTTDWGVFSDKEKHQAPKQVGELSINALGYAGFLLTRDMTETEALSSPDNAHILRVLTHTGFPNTAS